MLRQILLFQNNGRPVRDRRHPRHTDLYRFGTVGRAEAKQAEHARNGQCEFLQAHGFPPSFAGLAYFMASFSSRTEKIVGGPTDLAKSGLVGRKPTIRYMGSGNGFVRRAFTTARAVRFSGVSIRVQSFDRATAIQQSIVCKVRPLPDARSTIGAGSAPSP